MSSRPARWILPRVDEETARRLALELDVSPLVARILLKRGYGASADARRYLDAPVEDLHDPYRMKGMREASGRLAEAVRRREKILLYGDYDVDGTSSIVILKKALEIAGVEASFHVPHRLKDGYGMKAEVIEEAAAGGTKLIVSVDTGIRAAELVRHAGRLGVDVIITDHHLPEEEIPPALAVLNPNQPGCGYPEKNLCGAGVALKLVQALFVELDLPAARARKLVASFLKMAAIATVADVVPLTGENRIIVRHGLADLGGTTNPGLRALIAVAGFRTGERPSAGQVAFRLAPRINAAGRMASAGDVIEMFLTSDAGRARTIASELQDFNTDRQETEAAMVRDAIALAETSGWIRDEVRALVFVGEDWHRGVAGIVASRLAERYCRPVFVLGIDREKGEAQGSGRSAAGFHLLEGLEAMPELFRRFGGHKQAAGLAMAIDRVEEFRARFNEFACGRLDPEDLCPRFEVDAEIRLAEVNREAVEQLSLLEPFGFGNPAPLLAVRGARVSQPPVTMKEKHLRLRMAQDGANLVVKAWNWAERADRLAADRDLDLLLSLDSDDYWGISGTLKDVR